MTSYLTFRSALSGGTGNLPQTALFSEDVSISVVLDGGLTGLLGSRANRGALIQHPDSQYLAESTVSRVSCVSFV